MSAGSLTAQGFPTQRISSRTAIVLVLLAAHGLLLWLFWRVAAPVEDETEPFASALLFFPEPYHQAAQPLKDPHRSPLRPLPAIQRAPVTALVQPPTPANSTAITVPSPPGAGIDWSAELTGAADAALESERKANRQLEALLRKFEVEDDPRDPHRAPPTGFRWYQAGIHRLDTRGPLPVWHLNDRCVLLLFILPTCLIGHIETHGDLFENAAAAHDERTAAPRPNDVP